MFFHLNIAQHVENDYIVSSSLLGKIYRKVYEPLVYTLSENNIRLHPLSVVRQAVIY